VSVILAVIAVLWLFGRPSLGTFGFLTGRSLQNFLLGLGLGAGMLGLTLGLLRLARQLDLTSGAKVTWQPLMVMITAVLFNATAQEVMVRYFQVTTAEFASPQVGLVVSAIVFSVLHLGPTRGAPLPLLNVFLVGMVFGYGYLATGDLWFPIGIHFAWNVLLGPILGLTVSGRSLSGGWQLARVTGSNLLTGGAFGVEGGLAASIATCLGLLLLFLWYG
jgi:membrane protease YdiL (CAAX protease family)